MKKGLDHLKSPAYPQVRDLVRRQPYEALALEKDAAGTGTDKTADNVDERRLPRPVRPYYAEERILLDVDAHVVDGGHPSEPLRYALHLK